MLRSRVLVLALLALPSALSAQSVVGTVRDVATGQPVAGAMVRLMGSEGWTGALFVTASDGAFRLRAPGPGRYELTVERIGFASALAGPVTLGGAETRTFDVDVVTQPIRLEGLDVSAGRRRCSLPTDAEGATQALWAEARKALDLARWTEREAGLEFQVVRRTRSLDPRGLRLLDEASEEGRLFGGNSVRTLPPDELAQGGYVREVDGFIHYYGPDASVLLSDSFLETHCFQVVEDAEVPGMVGLAFRPIRDRSPDISGTLWVDRGSARLIRVEFAYTGLGRRPGGALARGELAFSELADGRWMVRDWFIQAPLLGLTRQFVAGAFRERVDVVAVQESGSEVLAALGPGVAWTADPMALLALRCPGGALIVGAVTDGPGGPGVQGAVITAEGGEEPLTAVSDRGGHYWLCGPRTDTVLRLVARRGELASAVVEVALGGEGHRVQDLVLPRAPGRG